MILFIYIGAKANDPDVTVLESLREDIKKIKESDKSDDEKEKKIKSLITKTINQIDSIRSTYTQGQVFDKAKRAKEIIANLKEGKTDFELKDAEEAPKEIEKPKVVQTAPFLKELFSEGLTDKDGKPVKISDLNGKVVGLYFSASWCGPCKRFTPELVKIRDENQGIFEVVFFSSDNSESDKLKYMNDFHMNWPSAKLNGENAKDLDKKYQVNGIPTLIILSKSGQLITEEGRNKISNEKVKEWAKEK